MLGPTMGPLRVQLYSTLIRRSILKLVVKDSQQEMVMGRLVLNRIVFKLSTKMPQKCISRNFTSNKPKSMDIGGNCAKLWAVVACIEI